MCAVCVCRLFGFVFPACDQKQQQQQQRGKQLFTCLMYEAESSGKAVSMYAYTAVMQWMYVLYVCTLSDVNSASNASCIHVERTAVYMYIYTHLFYTTVCIGTAVNVCTYICDCSMNYCLQYYNAYY